LLALPLLVGILGARFRDLVTHRLQSQLPEISYESIEWAKQLTNLPLIFLGTMVSIVMLPHLASIIHEHGTDTHRRTLEVTVETLGLLCIPIVAVSLVLAPELVSLIFINAQWSAADAELCSYGALAVRVIMLGLGFMVLENILLPGLFSIKSMWWPIVWGLVASAFQIICLMILARLGLPPDSAYFVGAIAFVFPLSRIFKNGVLMLVLRKKTNIFPGRRFVVLISRLWMLFVTVSVVVYGVHKGCSMLLGGIPTTAPLMRYKLMLFAHLAIPSGIAFAVYVPLLLMTGYKEHSLVLVRSLRNRKKKQQQQ